MYKNTQIIIVFFVGILLSVWLFLAIDKKSRDEIQQQFVSNTKNRFFRIESNIESEITILKSIVGLYDASDNVSRDEFKVFIDTISHEDEVVRFQALEWVPRVTRSERTRHANIAKNDGFETYRITEHSDAGSLITAAIRKEYFPVYYIEPYIGNELDLGFDLASNPAHKTALEKARDTGHLITSTRLNLVQLKKDRAGVLIFHPVYKEGETVETVKQRRQYLRGFVLGVVKINSIVTGKYTDSNKDTLSPMGIDFYVYDEADTDNETPLYIHHSRSRTDKAPSLSVNDARIGNYLEHPVKIGDRTWTLIARPAKPDFGYVTRVENLIVLFSGLILTLFLCVYLLMLSTRARTIERLVNTRTKELNDSEIRQRTILETIADAIIAIDQDGIIETFNPAAEKIFGYAAVEVIGKNVSILLPLHDKEDHKKYIKHSQLRAPRIVNQERELQACRKDGSLFPLELIISPMELEGNKGFVGVLRDISERKQAEQELDRFKTTLDETMDCVFMFEPDTLKFFYVNAGAMEQVGYSRDELMTMTTVDIKPEFDEALFRKTISPMIAGELSVLNFETLHEHKDGHTVPVEIFLQYVNPLGESPRFVAIVRDITERKRIDKMKNEFVSMVSHELRTPLTSVRGALGLITEGAVGEFPNQALEMLKIAVNNTERLLFLINDILDIQKIEAGEMTLKRSSLDLMPFLEQALQDNAAYGEQYGVKFVIDQKIEHARVYADRDRLMQVMANLLSNAAKFSPENETVEVSVAYRSDNFIRISVMDHGPGIPEEFQPKLFDKFTQFDSSDTRQKGGTGLGLSITKAIVEKHGGSIGFILKEGISTTFYVDLPEFMDECEND